MSSSSEIADSGRFAGQKAEKSSSFSQTYMSTAATGSTMNLFPVVEKPMSRTSSSMDLFPLQSGFDSSVKKAEPETAQMTIFYGGQVFVFNDLPADKVKEVMLLASKASSHNNPSMSASTAVKKPNEQTNLIPTSSSPVVPNVSNNMLQECTQQAPQRAQPIVSDLPIARRKSLSRFLEKRKDRITASAPYQTSDSKSSPPKPAEGKSWLGLAAEPPVQFELQS